MFLRKILISTICIENVILSLLTDSVAGAWEDKTLNLKIGFDLTRGDDGAPSLRIRQFDGSEENKPTTRDNEAEENTNVNLAVRADSLSQSDDTSVTRDNAENISKDVEHNPGNSDEDEDYDDSERNRIRSTKGLSPGEYEPEDNPKIHESYRGYSVPDSEDSRKRRRRDPGEYKEIKQRGKKVVSARKQGVSWF